MKCIDYTHTHTRIGCCRRCSTCSGFQHPRDARHLRSTRVIFHRHVLPSHSSVDAKGQLCWKAERQRIHFGSLEMETFRLDDGIFSNSDRSLFSIHALVHHTPPSPPSSAVVPCRTSLKWFMCPFRTQRINFTSLCLFVVSRLPTIICVTYRRAQLYDIQRCTPDSLP